MITYLVGVYGEDFFGVAHNIIGKGGSLVALVVLLLIIGRFIPEVFDEITSLMDLPKNNHGPLEELVGSIKRKLC